MINTHDINELSNVERRNFKYALIIENKSSKYIISYSQYGLKLLHDYIEAVAEDEGYYEPDAFEMVYPGDRESPPEYGLISDAEPIQTIEVDDFNDKYCCVQQTAFDVDIYFFNDVNALEDILKDEEIPIADIYTSKFEFNPDYIMSELLGDYDNITASEIQDLFN